MSDATDHECPTCGADHFENRKGMKIHHYRSHGERLVDTEICDHCGQEFEPTNKGVYCSVECRAAADRDHVTHECEHCGEAFEIPRYRADSARFCSHQCRADFQRKTATVDCKQCGERFEVQAHTGDERRFCSVQCSARYRRNRVRLKCNQCGRGFSVHACFDDQKYCCHDCRYEAQRTTSREFDDVDDLLEQLYLGEGWDLATTYRRQRAVLGHEDALFKKEVRTRLSELGIHRTQHQRRLRDADPEEIGGPAPEGDDSWRTYYGEGSADD